MRIRTGISIAAVFLALGVLCLFLENRFYGYVADDGVLQESFFLPLGMLCIAIGVILLILFGLLGIYRRF